MVSKECTPQQRRKRLARRGNEKFTPNPLIGLFRKFSTL
jgi:hypothetical protein